MNEIKALFPEGIETITISKNDYDRLYGQLTYENIVLQSKIDKAIEYCEEVIKEHNNGEYNVSTTELAIKEHKENIRNVLDILKENK